MENVRAGAAEIVVRPARGGAGTETGIDAGDCPYIIVLQAFGPADMAVGQIESQRSLEEVIGRGTVSVRIIGGDRLLLALQDAIGGAEVIAGANVKLTANGIDSGRLPDRPAAVTARLAALSGMT